MNTKKYLIKYTNFNKIGGANAPPNRPVAQAEEQPRLKAVPAAANITRSQQLQDEADISINQLFVPSAAAAAPPPAPPAQRTKARNTDDLN